MSLGLCFWIVMLIWLIFGGLIHFGIVGGVWAGANILLLFLLFMLLGWAIFGPPLHR